MGKKKFTSGLDSLFGDVNQEDTLGQGSVLLKKTRENKVSSRPTKVVTRKKTSKNFTSDLDSLFNESMHDDVHDEVEDVSARRRRTGRRLNRPKITGLDALITKTTDLDYDEMEREIKKRVTFVFDNKKYSKLKRIAKVESQYLKDILGKVVTEFIDDYETENGTINENDNK